MCAGMDCPVLKKAESEAMQAAVCLKEFPDGYVLGVSNKREGLHLWFTKDHALAEKYYHDYLSKMQSNGTPLGGMD